MNIVYIDTTAIGPNHLKQSGMARLENIGNVMIFSLAMMVLSAGIMSPSSTTPALPNRAAAQNIEGRATEGVWTGKFLQRDWTFDFRNENGAWSGKYMRSDGKSWLPLNELSISERSVSFSIESNPKVSFSLSIDAESRNLAGVATIDGIAAVPFSAARQP
jgi:hypothetical protein